MSPPEELLLLDRQMLVAPRLRELVQPLTRWAATRRRWGQHEFSTESVAASRALPHLAVLAKQTEREFPDDYPAARLLFLRSAQRVAREADEIGSVRAVLFASEPTAGVDLARVGGYMARRSVLSTLIRGMGLSPEQLALFWRAAERRKPEILGRPRRFGDLLGRFIEEPELMDTGGTDWEYLSPFRWTTFVGITILATAALAPLFIAPPVAAAVMMVFIVAGAAILAAGS